MWYDSKINYHKIYFYFSLQTLDSLKDWLKKSLYGTYKFNPQILFWKVTWQGMNSEFSNLTKLKLDSRDFIEEIHNKFSIFFQ